MADGLPSTRRRQSLLVGVLELLDDDLTLDLLAEALPAAGVQLGRELETAGALDRLQRDLELGEALLVGDARVGQDEGAQGDLAVRAGPFLGVDDLVEVRGDGDAGRVADDFVGDTPLAVRVAVREVQGPRDDADGRVLLGQAAAELLKVRPVVAVEAVADLRAHVGQGEGRVHGLLRPLGVRGGHLVAAVVARAEVVGQLGAEEGRDGCVLEEVAVLAVGVVQGEGVGRDVLGHPGRVAHAPVVGARQREAAQGVVHGAGEAILEDARGVDGRAGGGLGRERGRRGLGRGGLGQLGGRWRRESSRSRNRSCNGRRRSLLTGRLGGVEKRRQAGASGSAGGGDGGEGDLGHFSLLVCSVVGGVKQEDKKEARGTLR